MLCSGQKKVASYPSAVHPFKLSYVQMDACPGYFIQVCLPSFQTRFLLPGWTHRRDNNNVRGKRNKRGIQKWNTKAY